jgi:hypothetical protein
MNKNRQMEIFFPGLTGKDIRQIINLNLIEDESDLLILAFLLTWRCQLTTLMDDVLDKREIQQTDSQKFLAREFSSNKHVRKVFAAISVSRTLNFEFKNLNILPSDEERLEYLDEIITSLVNNPPPRGAKTLTAGSINSANLNFHRYGIMAELTGNCQSKPIFDPRSIIKGGIISTIDSQGFFNIFIKCYEKLLDTTDSYPDPDELVETIMDSIVLPESRIFNDSIDLGSKSNLAPIESIFELERTKPEPQIDIVLETDETSPFLLNALEQSKSYNKSFNQRGKSTPSKEIIKKKPKKTEKKSSQKEPSPKRKIKRINKSDEK